MPEKLLSEWLRSSQRYLVSAAVFWFLLTLLSGCASKPPVEIQTIKQYPPSSLLSEYPQPTIPNNMTIEQAISLLFDYDRIRSDCNIDKAALRAWSAE